MHRRVNDDLIAALLIAGGSVALLVLGGLGAPLDAGVNRDGGLWPFLMLSLLIVLGVTLGVQAWSKAHATPGASHERNQARGRVRKTLAILAYVPALFVFGFYVSALAYAFTLPPLLGAVRWRKSAAFALLFTAVLYAVFTVGLRMDLPQGYVALAWARLQAS